MSWVAFCIRAQQSRTFAGENRSRRNLHGNEEEGKKEETLIVGETILRTGRDFQPASQEKHLLRGVSFWQRSALSVQKVSVVNYELRVRHYAQAMAPPTAGSCGRLRTANSCPPAKFPALNRALCHNIPHAGRRICKREQVRINESQNNNNKERGEEQEQR